jgi:hypothetical protein
MVRKISFLTSFAPVVNEIVFSIDKVRKELITRPTRSAYNKLRKYYISQYVKRSKGPLLKESLYFLRCCKACVGVEVSFLVLMGKEIVRKEYKTERQKSICIWQYHTLICFNPNWLLFGFYLGMMLCLLIVY